MTRGQRRALVRRLIAEQPIATQQDLQQTLEERGVSVNQATLSRDLAEIGARRVHKREGGTKYELGDPAPQVVVPTLDLDTLVLDIASNGSLVVIHTSSGAASAVALMIDSTRIPGVLGTVAGDDTVFVAPRDARSADRLADALWSALSRRGPAARGANP
jgi:transcriptional regulator of arginine metabolism